MMLAQACQGGEQDRRHRGAESEEHHMFGRELLRVEQQQQHAYQHQAAAHTEHPGQESGDCAEHQIGCIPFHQSCARLVVMNFQSDGSSGVMDRRLPRCKVRMRSSSGYLRNSSMEISAIFLTSCTSTLNQRGCSWVALGSKYLPLRLNCVASGLSLIHISEPTRLGMISYAVFCL